VKIRSLRRGHSPNCSSAGSVVGAALISAALGGAVLNAYADRLARWLRNEDDARPKVRREDFGAIVAWPDPAALVELAGAAAAAALASGDPAGAGDAVPGALSAPTEVHLAVTSRCPVKCTGCYLDAGPDRESDPDLDALRADLERLAAMGVVEVAFGGGEAILRDDLVALLAHARSFGLVPNVTTSGFGLTPARARAIGQHVGQVNVSLDGLATYGAVRGWNGAAAGLEAIRTLREAGVRVGVNTVITRANFAELEALGDRIAAEGAAEWQWLRFKPGGRGSAVYAEMALAPEQALRLWPLALASEARTGLVMRWDCAMVPFLAAHGVEAERAAQLGVTGCAGGHSLLARNADGSGCPCWLVDPGGGVRPPPREAWVSDPVLAAWRARAAAPPEPCASCDWREVCRGGCRVVSQHLTGDAMAPDPECPRVRSLA
jgi:radical SAM protein with 4Fe4S-binding SPASM domain